MDTSGIIHVQILDKKLIKPSSPTPHHLTLHKLSFFDQLAPNAHVPLVYFYPLNDSSHQATAHILERLQKSLSEILTHFYPLAGRFSADGLSIDCNDQGALFKQAKANLKLDEFLQQAYRNIDLLRHFVPRELGELANSSPTTAPVVGVQATVFECGGLALTVLINHAVADGFVGCTFTDEWAKLCKDGSNAVKSLSFGVGSVFPPRDISGKLKPFPPLKPGPKIVTRSFMFDGPGISRLKDKVITSLNRSFQRQPSRVEVITALIWKGLICAAQARRGRPKASLTSLAVNLRGKTKTDVEAPENAFGNLYIQVPIKFIPETEDNKGMELHDFVVLIRETIQKAIARAAAAASGEEMLEMAVGYHNEIREGVGSEDVDVWICTSLSRFPIYSADLGWGRPKWVSSVNIPFEMMSLMDGGGGGGGIEARVNLNETDMAVFESDPDIVAFTSSTY